MNDPWDVKYVTQSGHYVSCMKINGVPLLPPILSRECRKEMQYYKILAKEIEKRITHLKTYAATTDTESTEDKTEESELPHCELDYVLPIDKINNDIKINTTANDANIIENCHDVTLKSQHRHEIMAKDTQFLDSSKFVIDLSLSINKNGINLFEGQQNSEPAIPAIELPERDYDCSIDQSQDMVKSDNFDRDVEKCVIEQVVNIRMSVNKGGTNITDPTDLSLTQDGPSSLVSSKSFTGSLNDIHTEFIKESHKLIRQSSYTVLNPSPQLMAHLEVQSLSTGVDLNSISMSDSLSNNEQNKKRRNWDLETAKEKWSSMAMELDHKKGVDRSNHISVAKLVTKTAKKTDEVHKKDLDLQTAKEKLSSMAIELDRKKVISNNKTVVKDSVTKKTDHTSPHRQRSTTTKHKTNGVSAKNDISLKAKKPLSQNITANHVLYKEPSLLQIINPTEPSIIENNSEIVSKIEDPAMHIRELYERLQKQQMKQMSGLMEKQKREQMMLQQVFEEQNNLLYSQLKTICPKSSIEAKPAWNENKIEATVEQGPVSLSQLINQKSPEPNVYDTSMSVTLTDTNHYISHCDNVLKQSRDITGSLKKQQPKTRSPNSDKSHTPKHPGHLEVNKNRTSSPNSKMSASRKLQYDTSASFEREYEPILTDRTNDTLADLNVTFPSDQSYSEPFNHNNVMQHFGGNQTPVTRCSAMSRSTDTSTKCADRTISRNTSTNSGRSNLFSCQPTTQQLSAASTIVAYAKGYLVRRLMRTERVQSTVRTIREALVCALQLHQDREGIRGADVDLHRRLIQQITAACYTLHDTFVASSPAERCAVIAADRRRRAAAALSQQRHPNTKTYRHADIMSQSHSGAFPARPRRQASPAHMTHSSYEMFSGGKCGGAGLNAPARAPRRPWR